MRRVSSGMRFDSLLVLSLLAACTTLEPPPADRTTTPTPPGPKPDLVLPQPSCTGGDVVFQVDRKTVYRPEPSSSLVVRTSGAWTYDTLHNGTLVRTRTGCLAADQLADLRAHVERVPWQTTKPDSVCEIAYVDFTEYRVGDRHVFTSAGCTSDLLDDKSRVALSAANAIVGPLVRPT
jgi:hypothetical protein